eukprot:jgi/Mesvir1/10746/Mv25435-RA.1
MDSITRSRVTEAIVAQHGVVPEEAPPLAATEGPSPPQPYKSKEGLLVLDMGKGKRHDFEVRDALVVGDPMPDIPSDEAAFQAALREHEIRKEMKRLQREEAARRAAADTPARPSSAGAGPSGVTWTPPGSPRAPRAPSPPPPPPQVRPVGSGTLPTQGEVPGPQEALGGGQEVPRAPNNPPAEVPPRQGDI